MEASSTASHSISADASTAAVGGPNDNGSIGDAWIFHNNNGTWTQVGSKVTTVDLSGYPQLGPVSLSGNGGTLLLGGPVDNGGQGTAWVFVASGPAPTLTSIHPTQTDAGGANFTLTANGMNFINGAAVAWGGVPLTTTYGSSSQVTAAVPASLLVSGGTNPITVVNPDGTPTNASNFNVLVPSLSIAEAQMGNFAYGENGATYAVTVTNAAGAAPTSGIITVTDTLPTPTP